MLLVLVLVMMLVQVLVLIILIEMSPEMMLPLLVFALAEMKGMAVLLYIVVKFLNGWISCGL